MQLHFLGTGAGVPSKQRNTSALSLRFLNDYNGALWFFDCGEAMQHQILHTSLKLSKLTRIFITHLHGDHIFGLPGLLGSRSFQGGTSQLTIYGPKGLKSFIETSLSISKTVLRYPLAIEEIKDNQTIELPHHFIKIKKLDHGIDSYGYRIIEKNKPGQLLVDKLKQLGIPPGPVYKAIKNGEQVQLEDGRIIDGKEFIGPEKKGKVITILGDTRPCEAALELAENADVLVHEATFMEKDRELAYEYFHSTNVDAANTAKKANVSKLILTHISSRYQNEQIEELLKEAQAIFPETAIAKDFSVFDI